MLELLRFINFLLDIYIFVLFAAAILSWLIVFNVVNTRNPAVAMIGEFLYRVFQSGADRRILCEIEHYRRDWMRSARVLKSETPWSS